MKNFEKRLQALDIDGLLRLEEEILECDNCYCREFCESKAGKWMLPFCKATSLIINIVIIMVYWFKL